MCSSSRMLASTKGMPVVPAFHRRIASGPPRHARASPAGPPARKMRTPCRIAKYLRDRRMSDVVSEAFNRYRTGTILSRQLQIW